MATQLETIVRDAKVAFLIAKHDGVLEASEIVQIALEVAQKVYALGSLSDDEKDAMILLALKKGLAAAEGLCSLPAFAAIPAGALDALENQMLQAGLTAVKAMRAAAPRLFAPVKDALRSCVPYFSLCASAATSVLPPKDAKMIQDALKCAELVAGKPAEPVAELVAGKPAEPVAEPVAGKPADALTPPTQESVEVAPLVVRPVTPPVVDIPLPNTVHEEPNPVASR
jgi:hypothetical protein